MTTVNKAQDFFRFSAGRKLANVRKVILVGSGKGGVGKSLVACALGLRLSDAGYRTGILDTDLHGASIPMYLGVEPPVRSGPGGLIPKVSGKTEIMSIALFTGDSPVPVRGGRKQELITELFTLTDWGNLDFLVIDLPPSTGDELLTAFNLFAGKSSLVLVTTPSAASLSVVSRLRRLAGSEKVPVAGFVLNMAFIVAGGKRAYPFGKVGPRAVTAKLKAPLLAQIPLDPAVGEVGLRRALGAHSEFSESFDRLAKGLLKG